MNIQLNRKIKSTDKSKFRARRVDTQVSILTACIVAVSCFAVYIFGYTFTYKDMLYSLKERVYSIYNFLGDELDPSAFSDINIKADMSTKIYQDNKQIFTDIKLATGVQYLYTAKRNPAGELIYVIDGLPNDAEDFRCPGDLIETEIADKLNLALTGEVVLPNDILHTSWGDIFVTYLPMYDGDEQVIGVIGIEFTAGHQYQTYRMLRLFAPLVILVACALGTFLALIFFRRISNPHFQDIANTDYLTDLKNRNAYEIDIKNICANRSAVGMGLILADLNGLKLVNDSCGHDVGDVYIKTFADSLRCVIGAEGLLYRMGGDEFLAAISSATDEQLQEISDNLHVDFQHRLKGITPNGSCSIGYSICDANSLDAFEATYRQADTEMYKNKQIYYSGKDAMNRRCSYQNSDDGQINK